MSALREVEENLLSTVRGYSEMSNKEKQEWIVWYVNSQKPPDEREKLAEDYLLVMYQIMMK